MYVYYMPIYLFEIVFDVYIFHGIVISLEHKQKGREADMTEYSPKDIAQLLKGYRLNTNEEKNDISQFFSIIDELWKYKENRDRKWHYPIMYGTDCLGNLATSDKHPSSSARSIRYYRIKDVHTIRPDSEHIEFSSLTKEEVAEIWVSLPYILDGFIVTFPELRKHIKFFINTVKRHM
jgi:hypothetical protein